jgi:hypothetical protein
METPLLRQSVYFAVGCDEELGSCELYRTAASIAATARGVAGWLRINLANRAQAR